MARYYYDVYSIETSWGEWGEENVHAQSSIGSKLMSSVVGRKKPTWNGDDYEDFGFLESMDEINIGSRRYSHYNCGDGSCRRYQLIEKLSEDNDGRFYTNIKTIRTYSRTRKRIEEKGDFIETIEAEEGEYPDDGKYTDGYWYVKRGKVNSLKVNIDGEIKDVTNMYANIDGQPRKIIKIFYNINGELKEG